MRPPAAWTLTALASLALPLLLGACLEGKEPPASTEMVQLPASSAPFTLGPGRGASLSCGDATTPEHEHCDSGKQTDPLLWLPELSWVPPATATVQAFSIDVHEVTNEQYAYCVESGACDAPAFAEIDGNAYYGAGEYADHPVVYVSRAQARAYCDFVGKRLPSEAEWEWAARLGKDETDWRTYPWVEQVPGLCNPASATYALSQGCAPLPAAPDYSEADRTYHGVRNMASNVSEWVEDDWHPYAYCAGRKPYDEACQTAGSSCAQCQADGDLCAASCVPSALVICKGGTYAPFAGNATEGVVRGGSYRQSRCFHRLYVRRKGVSAKPDVGFRCAR